MTAFTAEEVRGRTNMLPEHCPEFEMLTAYADLLERSPVVTDEVAKSLVREFDSSPPQLEYWRRWKIALEAVWPVAAEPVAQGQSEQNIAGNVNGWTVSVDVSSGEHDAEHRIFGTVIGYNGDRTLLAVMTEDNHPAEPVAQAEAIKAAARECSMRAYAYWHDGPESATYYEHGLPNKEAHEAPYATIIRRALAAQPRAVPNGWVEFYSNVMSSLSKIVNTPQLGTTESELLPRGLVMESVMDIRRTLDEFSKIAGPTQTREMVR